MPSNKTSPVNSICARGNINSSEADYITIHIKKKSYVFNIQLVLRYICLKGEFVVVSTAKICARSLSSKIPVDMNSIFMKLCHMTNVT
jgi:hypothetical protein